MSERRSHYTLPSRILSFAVLGTLSVLMMFPLVWMLLTSFKTNSEVYLNSTAILPSTWTVQGYIDVFENVPIFKWFFNSIFVTGVLTVIILFTSTLLGFVFARYEFRFKKPLFVLLLCTMMVPDQVVMIPRYLMIQQMGLFNTLWALIIPGMVSAFGVYLSRQFIEDLPESLCDAAKIDGASSFGIYWHVVLPNIKSAIGALAIFTAMGVWNDYLTPLIMINDVDKMTLPLALSMFSNQFSTNIPATMAAATLIMAPVIVLFILLQKQFVQSIALSGMK